MDFFLFFPPFFEKIPVHPSGLFSFPFLFSFSVTKVRSLMFNMFFSHPFLVPPQKPFFPLSSKNLPGYGLSNIFSLFLTSPFKPIIPPEPDPEPHELICALLFPPCFPFNRNKKRRRYAPRPIFTQFPLFFSPLLKWNPCPPPPF